MYSARRRCASHKTRFAFTRLHVLRPTCFRSLACAPPPSRPQALRVEPGDTVCFSELFFRVCTPPAGAARGAGRHRGRVHRERPRHAAPGHPDREHAPRGVRVRDWTPQGPPCPDTLLCCCTRMCRLGYVQSTIIQLCVQVATRQGDEAAVRTDACSPRSTLLAAPSTRGASHFKIRATHSRHILTFSNPAGHHPRGAR